MAKKGNRRKSLKRQHRPFRFNSAHIALSVLLIAVCLLLGTCNPSAPGPQDPSNPANPQNPLQPGTSPAPSGAAVSPLACPSTPASENALYVSKSGSDSNPCTQASPCLTINSGIAKMKGGDTLIVGAGTYAEIITDYAGTGGYTVRPPNGTSWSNMTTIKAETPRTVTLRLSGGHPSGSGWSAFILFDQADTQFIQVEGFVLDGAYNITNGAMLSAPNIRFKDLEVTRVQQGFFGSNTENQIINAKVHNLGYGPNGENSCRGSDGTAVIAGFCHGVYTRGTGVVVDGGEYHTINGYGIQMYASNATVRNTYIHNVNSSGIIFIGGGGTAENNIIANNRGGGIGGGGSQRIYHNTVYNNGQNGAHLDSAAHEVKNNIFIGHTYDILDEHGGNTSAANLCTSVGGGCTLSGRASSVFVNAAGGDFHLQSASPAKNAGTDGKDLGVDFTQIPSNTGPCK
jgi:hypothetical protein